MKAILFGVALTLAGLTSAQPGLPTCAQSCVTQFTSGSNIGSCNSLDIACICSNSNFLGGIACCLAGACSPADQVAATNYAQSFCKISGVTDLPTAVSCTSTAASTGSGSAATGAPNTASSSPSSSSTGSSAAELTSSVASSVSSAVSSASKSVASGSSSASASATKNAGLQNMAGDGSGVFGGVAAVVAAVVLL